MRTNNNSYDDLIIFSSLISDYEKLDFKNDVLAGVRANYFNSRNSVQSEKTDISINDKSYNLSYYMKNGEPLNWKITRNNNPFQSVKKATGGVYVVLSYTDDGVISKRQYFNSEHNWLRTEYFDIEHENVVSALLSPKKISGYFTLEYQKIDELGNKTTAYLFPSQNAPLQRCAGLVYSNYGMLWFDPSFKPSHVELLDSATENQKTGFNFSLSNFDNSSILNSFFNFDNADYLEKVETDVQQKVQSESEQSNSDENGEYSAYDKIEKILFDAHKTNKDLFGAILSHTSDETPNAISDNNEKVEQTEQNSEEIEENISDESDDFDTEPKEFEYSVQSQPTADSTISTATGDYLYFGELNAENKRAGRGRTVTPNGITSYEGEYENDKRQGFGVCYYKNGSANYVGSWQNGERTGSGVGYRLSDGTMHAGKWFSNKPDGIGARFDKFGNFISVSNFSDGVKNGKSVSFDEKGNVVISYYENGELVSEKIINDEE